MYKIHFLEKSNKIFEFLYYYENITNNVSI
jgi:hypothetical protein